MIFAEWMLKLFLNPEVLVLAFFLDLLLGDPRWLPHPVVGMGKTALFCEPRLRFLGGIIGGPKGEFLAGLLLVLLVCGGSFLFSGALLGFLFAKAPGPAGLIVSAFLVYTTIAVKSLVEHARAVALPLAEGRLLKARQAVSMIVGRDISSLAEPEMARAAVESIAENTSDGIVAPLFYAAIGGTPLALAYWAVNTLDAMYGHRTPENLYFGRAAARLDDFLNYLPARLTALLFLVTGFLMRKNTAFAWQVLLRDGGKHPSPNSGRPEAAMAGVLNIRLGGVNSYHGEVSLMSYLNAAGRPVEEKDVEKALKVMQISSMLALVFCVLLNLLIYRVILNI